MVAPWLANWRETQRMTVDKDTPNLAEVITKKATANEMIPLIESALYPEDE